MVIRGNRGIFRERLRAVSKAKGLTEENLSVRFGRSRAHSWIAGYRVPRADTIGFEVAEFLEVPLDFLYGRPSPLDSLSIEHAVALSALNRLLAERPGIPVTLRTLYEQFAKSIAAPHSVARWKALISELVEPVSQLAIQEGTAMTRMLESGVRKVAPRAPRRKHQ